VQKQHVSDLRIPLPELETFIEREHFMGTKSAADQWMICNFGRMGQCSLRKDWN